MMCHTFPSHSERLCAVCSHETAVCLCCASMLRHQLVDERFALSEHNGSYPGDEILRRETGVVMVIAAASYAFTGGRILTMDPTVAQAKVVITAGEQIVAVGERGLLAGWPGAEVIDLGGRILLPGFIDAHNHLSLAALHPRWADLSEVRSLEDLAAALHGQAAREPDADWVRGAGWQGTEDWLRSLTRRELDALGLDRPVIVAHSSLHMCVVCSRGLEMLGIGRGMPDPDGGLIGRGRDGQPTGLLIERAWSQAQSRSLAAYSDNGPQRVRATSGCVWARSSCSRTAGCSSMRTVIRPSMRTVTGNVSPRDSSFLVWSATRPPQRHVGFGSRCMPWATPACNPRSRHSRR